MKIFLITISIATLLAFTAHAGQHQNGGHGGGFHGGGDFHGGHGGGFHGDFHDGRHWRDGDHGGDQWEGCSFPYIFVDGICQQGHDYVY